IQGCGQVSLIIIDPISAYLGNADGKGGGGALNAVEPLATLAARHGAAVICIAHLSKAGRRGDALMRVGGNSTFVTAARSAWSVTQDADTPQRRLLLPLKNIYGTDSTGLAFSVTAKALNHRGAAIATTHVVWEPEPVTMSANEALAQNELDSGALLDAK